MYGYKRNRPREQDTNVPFGLKQYAAPASEPLTLADAKAHLRQDITDDDTYISSLISAARAHVENWIGRRLVTQTWDLARDDFPVGAREITIPYGPVQSISSITYLDSGGNSIVLDPSLYLLDTYGISARCYPVYTKIWPLTRYERNAVIIRYVTGYGAAAAVPANIVHAMKMLISHWYENREIAVDSRVNVIPQTVEALLSSEREAWL